MSYSIRELGDVCSILNGGTPKSEVNEYWGGEINWITPKEMGKMLSKDISITERKITEKGLKNSSAKLLPINSVILSSRAPIGHLAINKQPMATNQGCKGLVPSGELSHEYLYYFLAHSRELLNDLGSGATFKELSSAKLSSVKIPVPSLEIQQKIVKKLDVIFAEIDKASAAAETNIKNAETLFQDYLIKTFDNNLAWHARKLKEVSKKITDGSHNPPKGVEFSKFLMFSSKNINNDAITFESPRYLSEIDFETENKRTDVSYGDVLLTIVGTIGRCAVVEDKDLKITLQRSVSVIKPLEIINSRFLMYLLLSKNKFLNERARGVAQKGIYLETLRELEISFPDLNQQLSIVEKLDDLKSKLRFLVDSYEEKKHQLISLNNAFLKDAFNGQLIRK